MGIPESLNSFLDDTSKFDDEIDRGRLHFRIHTDTHRRTLDLWDETELFPSHDFFSFDFPKVFSFCRALRPLSKTMHSGLSVAAVVLAAAGDVVGGGCGACGGGGYGGYGGDVS